MFRKLIVVLLAAALAACSTVVKPDDVVPQQPTEQEFRDGEIFRVGNKDNFVEMLCAEKYGIAVVSMKAEVRYNNKEAGVSSSHRVAQGETCPEVDLNDSMIAPTVSADSWEQVESDRKFAMAEKMTIFGAAVGLSCAKNGGCNGENNRRQTNFFVSSNSDSTGGDVGDVTSTATGGDVGDVSADADAESLSRADAYADAFSEGSDIDVDAHGGSAYLDNAVTTTANAEQSQGQGQHQGQGQELIEGDDALLVDVDAELVVEGDGCPQNGGCQPPMMGGGGRD